MSGPKIDYAELERRKREELERARQERLRKIKSATDSLHKEISTTKKVCTEITESHKRQISQASNIDVMEITVQRIETIKKEYVSKLSKLVPVNILSEPEDILRQSSELQAKREVIYSEYSKCITNEFKRLDEYVKSKDTVQEYRSFADSLANQENKQYVIKDVAFEDIESVDVVYKSEVCDVARIVDEIKELVNIEYLFNDDRKKLLEFYKGINISANESKSALKLAINEYNMARVNILRRMDEFEALYLEYVAEFVAYIDVLNKGKEKKETATPKLQSCFTSISELEDEIALVQRMAKYENEQQYIRNQIDEVMERFGYDMCESVVLSPLQKGHHYISQDLNGETAIHIHISESKQIMMEVVAVGQELMQNTDTVTARAEDVDAISEDEREVLLEEQGRFCDMHPLIIEELQKRGVILTVKTHRAPAVEHCKKIVNYVSEFNDKATKSSYVSKRKGNKGKKTEMKIK